MFLLKHASSIQEVRIAYDRLYAQRWFLPRASLLAWLVRLLKAKPGQALLDVACGDAQMAQSARQIGLIYYGVDISFSAVRIAHTEGNCVADGAYLPFASNQFDFVTSVGSLEHYLDMAAGVCEIARVLKPNGRACVLVPNAFGLTWNVMRVWRSGELADDDEQPIQRFGTRQAWHQLLEANGLDVRQVRGHERMWPRTREDVEVYVNEPKEILLALLAPFLSVNMKRCFIFLCTKRSPKI
jgi:SAM-dependent methyltransferase